MSPRTVILVALVAVLSLAGCTVQNTGYSAQTARPLQEQVLAVAESSAAGNPTASLTRLDELVASLKDARAKGAVSADRYASIMASVALVRTDLEAAVAVQNEQQNQQKNEKPGKGAGKKKS